MARLTGTSSKTRPLGRSLADFGHLNNAEKDVIAAAREGTAALFGEALPTEAQRESLTVRADLVRFLALGGDDATPVHEKGVFIFGGCIDGELDLDGCTLVGDLQLLRCEIMGELSLRGASTHTVSLGGSRCSRILANGVRVSGHFIMSAGFCATGLVQLSGAQISGRLDCDGGCFEGKKPPDEDSPPQASMNCGETSDQVAEEEEHDDAMVADALVCEGAEIGFQARLGDGFRAAGRVSLVGATVGFLDCSGGSFEGGSRREPALNCDGIEVRREVFLRGVHVPGGFVRFIGAKIGHDLTCRDALFGGRDADGAALTCDSARIGGGVFLNEVVTAGDISLVGAEIGGDVSCGGGVYGSEQTGTAEEEQDSGGDVFADLILSRATVADTLWLAMDPPATFHGGVDLRGARIRRIVDGVKAADQDVDAGAHVNPAFLGLDGLVYERFAEGTDPSAAARIKFLKLQTPDDLGENFKPQPWEQMIKVLRDMGHGKAARAVAIEKQRALRRSKKITGLAGLVHDAYGLFYGYGYRPLRLATWALGLAVLAALFFWVAAEQGVMMPTDRRILDDPQYAACRVKSLPDWGKCEPLRYKYTVFNPFLYSLELILPIAGSQQTKDWTAAIVLPCTEITHFGICRRFPADASASAMQPKPGYTALGIAAAIVARLENLFGWLAGLMFVAVASGLVKKD